MSKPNNYLIGIFDDEDVLLSGVKKVRDAGANIYEVFTPFPVHGLEHALGYKRSKLPVAAFLFGMCGTMLALLMMTYMMGIDWPMIIGGKDFIAVPDFIPVTFELTVLLSAFGMVGTFFVMVGLKPYATPEVYDVRQTDDKHVMIVDLDKNKFDEETLRAIIRDAGASEVNNPNSGLTNEKEQEEYAV
ncbi:MULTISPECIES: DUF3341 domain-containing protein [Persicobacter]|uniref:Membrane protein n=1 Tax=Persicobacter diffluens TaxID=981 RepID=A0AAN4VX82_9BACT|nr:DUF3341 domain-containing protein [Persicobacter sp. CCB-QB2]GJM61686.1 membrane protein [Persicobacter diffluens]